MKSYKKLTLVFLTALLTVCAASMFISSVNAASNFTIQVSASDPTVHQDASYTVTITNIADTGINGLNVTVPLGYTKPQNLAIAQQPSSQVWTINFTNSVVTINDQPVEITTIALTEPNQALTNGQSLTFTFDITNPQVAGNYAWVADSTNSDSSVANASIGYNIIISSILPVLAILGIAAGIAFLNSGINRILIGYFIGWEQYRVMQKEMAEYRSESMAAARSGDKKRIEKTKKKQSQITHMQQKMLKPQMLQFGISFVYLIVWFLVLTPTFGGTSLAYLPGFGPIPVFYLYPMLSLFLGLLSSRIIGIMPIEQ